MSSTTSTLPGEVAELLSKGRAALERRDAGALTALAESGESLSWLGSKGFDRQPKWDLAILRLPAPAAAPLPAGSSHPTPDTPRPTPSAHFLAVFHSYHTVQSIGDHIHRVVKSDGGWRIGAEIPETETLGFRVVDHRITARIEPKSSRCAFTDDAVIERKGTAAGSLCLLRLSSILSVDSVTAGAGRAQRPISHSVAPGVIAVAAPSGSFSLTIKYRGVYNGAGQDSYINAREAALTSYWWPHVARLPAKLAVTVTAPKGWIAIGQGEPTGRVENSDSTTFSFRNEIPVCYFTLDAAPYVVTSREIAGRRVSACLLKANPERAKSMLDQFARALPFFEKTFGPFPYSHYEMVESAGPFGGALEAYSFATYGPGSFGAVVHELSHTWWGGLLPNTYLRTMWNESFADYSDGLASRMAGEGPRSPALRDMHKGPDFGRALLVRYAVPASRAFDTSNGAHGAVGYGKGAEVLAMLEDLLGTETMLKCVRRFISDHPRGEPADWPDFEKAVNRATGSDYRWFFAQWIERGGAPILGIANLKQAAGEVWFDILQEGVPYRLRIPVEITLVNGNRMRRTVDVRSASESIRLPVGEAVNAVTLDPDGTILAAGRRAPEPAGDPFTVKAAR